MFKAEYEVIDYEEAKQRILSDGKMKGRLIQDLISSPSYERTLEELCELSCPLGGNTNEVEEHLWELAETGLIDGYIGRGSQKKYHLTPEGIRFLHQEEIFLQDEAEIEQEYRELVDKF